MFHTSYLGLPSRFTVSSALSKAKFPSTLISSAITSSLDSSVVSSISCRLRIKPSRYPLQWVKKELIRRANWHQTLTINQYLAERKGLFHKGMHPPILKSFKKKTHVFNPFVKLRINNLDDIFEQLEYVQNQRKANAESSSLMTVSDGQINDELSKIRASQIKRNAKRDQQLAALNDAIASAKEAKRQERIKAKKEAARNLRSQDSVVEEDYEEEPEVVPVRS